MAIPWLSCSPAVMDELARRGRPVLIVVEDPGDPRVTASIREVLAAMEAHPHLPELLEDRFPALRLEAKRLPGPIAAAGAGSSYYVAILSPAPLKPLGSFDVLAGKPRKVVDEIVWMLKKLDAA